MKELVYSNGSQVAPDEEKEEAPVSKTNIALLGMAVFSAYTALQDTDLSQIAQKVKQTVKSPLITAVLIAAFVYLGCSDDN